MQSDQKVKFGLNCSSVNLIKVNVLCLMFRIVIVVSVHSALLNSQQVLQKVLWDVFKLVNHKHQIPVGLNSELIACCKFFTL